MQFENLRYYILGEVVTVIITILLCYNVFTSLSPYEKRHRLFMYASVACLLSPLFDILSVIANSNYPLVNSTVCLTFATFFYIFLPVVPVMMFGYAVELAYPYQEKISFFHLIIMGSYIVYFIFLIINLFTGCIFYIDPVAGYSKGPFKNITYIYAAFIMIFLEFVICTHRKKMATRMFTAMLFYPVIAMLILCVQFFFPKVLLTGTSSLAALLLGFMTLQSDMLDYDLITGLTTEHKLEKVVQLKNKSGILFILSIENMPILQNNLSSKDMNSILLMIGKEFSKRFEKDSYHIALNRFGGICEDKETVEKYGREISDYIKHLGNFTSFDIPAPIEFYSAGIEFAKGIKSYSNVCDIVNNLLQKAKSANTKTIQFCDESVLLDMERKRLIFNILKRELNADSKQFQVWFQPIYSIKEKRLVYMEALSRLNGTELGDIPPFEFVQVAETRGLIETLGNVAFQKICKFISENKDVIKAVSINFSVNQMSNPLIVDSVLQTIKKYNLEPSNIIMEITESIFIDNYEIVYKNMKTLADAGILFYLDDFGTGYSNFANIINLPFSTIKMDRSLVLSMEESSKNINLFKNLVSTFKDAGLKVLVEGVETQNQNYLVTKAGADYIQGYLYSRPVPANQCLEIMKNNRS